MIRGRFSFLFLLLAVLAVSTSAFVTPSTSVARTTTTTTTGIHPATALAERRWNFNEGQAPWGMKKNAEIWNGRVGQVRKNTFYLVVVTSISGGLQTFVTTMKARRQVIHGLE